MANSEARRIHKMTEKIQEIYEKKSIKILQNSFHHKKYSCSKPKYIVQFKDNSTVLKEVRGLVHDGTKEYLESASHF